MSSAVRIHVVESAAEAEARAVVCGLSESGQEEAFFVCDLGEVVRRHSAWRLLLPRVEPFYAVKCNPHPPTMRVLAALGCGFDCASKAEIAQVLEMGVCCERIIFANPTKQASHIRYAAQHRVCLMTFDNETELHKTKALYPEAELVLRLRCDASDAQCPLGMKFGAERHQVPALLAKAKDLGLHVVGISFHVGSGCKDPPIFRQAIGLSKWAFDLASDMGFQLRLLDIGGGFPGSRSSSLDSIAEIVNSALEQHFPEGCGVRIISEPGRFFVAAAFTLATAVHSIREVEGGDPMYYVNDGVYGSFNCLLYDHAEVVPLPLRAEEDPAKWLPCSVWGPTCDGLDCICSHCRLPQQGLGDWILFPDMGAYTLAAAGTFNGFPVPQVHVVITRHMWLVVQELLLARGCTNSPLATLRCAPAATGLEPPTPDRDLCKEVDPVS